MVWPWLGLKASASAIGKPAITRQPMLIKKNKCTCVQFNEEKCVCVFNDKRNDF